LRRGGGTPGRENGKVAGKRESGVTVGRERTCLSGAEGKEQTQPNVKGPAGAA